VERWGMSYWILGAFVLMGSLFIAKLVFVSSILSVFAVTRGAMFHPSASIRVRTFLDGVPMTGDELLIDMGCGDGRVLSGAYKRYGVRAIGYEVNPIAYLLAKLRTIGKRGVAVRWQNFWKTDVGDADVLFCYLFPDVMEKVARKLESELHPGARVVSGNFPLPGWTHLNVFYPPSSLNNSPIYVYRFPESCPRHSARHCRKHD
jgi:SAM-dependent methyltransferase